MSKDVVVFVESRDGALKKITLELINAARSLAAETGGKIHLAVAGAKVAGLIGELSTYTDGKILSVESDLLVDYSTQGYAGAIQAILERVGGSVIVLFGATAMGKDLSPRVAARCDAALFTDCTEVAFKDGHLWVKRPVYSGKVYAECSAARDGIEMASIRPNIFPPAEKLPTANAEVEKLDLPVAGDAIKAMVREIVATSGGRKDITEAEIIVSGGRALKSTENFKILEELADVLDASVGASRAAVDAGYAPHAIQVGQTGKVVNPKLYIAVGISGAIQHLVGMRTSKVIVAINKDPNAPIFQKADYGIVGDLFEIVPLLTEEFKKLLAT